MSDHQDSSNPGTRPPAHRAAAKTVSLSLPLVLVMVGVSSLALVLATLVGYQLRIGGVEEGPSLAESAATAPQSSGSLADEAVATDSPQSVQEALERVEALEASSAATAPVKKKTPKSRGVSTIEAPADRGMLHVKPTNVVIPKIGVISDLVNLGLNADNSLQVPEDYSKAGWFTQGSYPGDLGGPPALIVGHVDNKEGPAVFYALDQLKIGDEVLVGRADGSTAVFVIYDGQQFPKDTLPTEEIYGERDGSELVLITCTGEFNPQTGHYLDNYVVRAKLDPKRSGLAA
ncbi:MAG: class F sortase [Ornithinimicrobium sp.]